MITIQLDKRHQDELLRWIEDKKARLSDFRPLFATLRPIIDSQVKEEFSVANPNDWKALSPQYRAEKVAAGYPDIIGWRTGGLRHASTEGALLELDKTTLKWKVDLDHVNSEGERVGDYALTFNLVRRQFQYSVRYLNTLLRETVAEWVRKVLS